MALPKILLFGKGGQVTTELAPLLSVLGELNLSGPDDCSFEDSDGIQNLILKLRPDIIVNGAAYTAVDKAETERQLCSIVNGTAVHAMAKVAKELNALLVHYSTDYVFDGNAHSPYEEDAIVNPKGVYGISKREGELFLQASGASYFLFRTAWVYSCVGKNFMKTMLHLGRDRKEVRVVDDQTGCPTSAKLIAIATTFALHKWWTSSKNARSEIEGVYHLVASGSCSWHEFAVAIFSGAKALEKQGKSAQFLQIENTVPIPSKEYPTPAFRPQYSVLNNSKFQQVFGLRLPPWQEVLETTLAEYLTGK